MPVDPAMAAPTPLFRLLLIANRGEVAVRVARTARELGVRTAAIFAPDDAQAAHRWAADEAHEVRHRARISWTGL